MRGSLVATDGSKAASQPQAEAEIDHERYKKLVGTYVVIGGRHEHKGFYGEIRDYLGNFHFRIVHRSASRMLEVHVDSLLST